MEKEVSRRDFIRAGAAMVLGTAGAVTLSQATQHVNAAPPSQEQAEHNMASMGMPGTVGEVDHKRNGFDPTDILTDFDYGQVSQLENGQTLREYNFVSVDKIFELVPGIEFSGWAFNGRIPGPTIRCTEGDRIRINFT